MSESHDPFANIILPFCQIDSSQQRILDSIWKKPPVTPIIIDISDTENDDQPPPVVILDKEDTNSDLDLNDSVIEGLIRESFADPESALKAFDIMPQSEKVNVSDTQNKYVNVAAKGSNNMAKKPDLVAILKKLEPFLKKNDDVSAENDTDFLATAKKKGLTFPRPRWWPKERLK